jgi:threonine aldolase
MIDLRSDTVTQPTPAMRRAMAEAPVGDDVFGEDPSVLTLEAEIASRLGKEAALFVPSGTMGNQIGVRLHCQSGDEFLADSQCHILHYEQAAYAQLFGVAARPIDSADHLPPVPVLQDALRPENVHFPRTRLLCLENTHNRGGGLVLPFDEVAARCLWAADAGLGRHLDGARLFNAVVASGIAADRWAGMFDTVSVCFSKGLGAPVGSAVCGTAEAIARARRHRKALGGGMRQAGILAAAASYALKHHVDRLTEDHDRARRLAEAVAACPGLSLPKGRPMTNLVIFGIASALGSAESFCGRLADAGVRMLPIARDRVRAVTHLQIDDEAVDRAAAALRKAAIG